MRRSEGPQATANTRSLADAVERQAALHPDATAVQLGERSLTYAQLDAHANRVARRLREFGATRGDVVGLLAERGPETVVGALGVLKAGAAYAPLDPDSPQMRLRRQLDAVRARAVVAPAALADRLAGVPQPLLALDPAFEELAGEDAVRLPLVPDPSDLCAVLFTSGSTGIPKGVALEHRNLLNLLARERDLAPRPGEGALHVSAPQFDVAAYELWATLANGGRLVCHPPGRPDPRAVCATVVEREVTWAAVATSVFHQLSESGPEPLAGIRMLLVGGEALQPRYARRFRAACPRTRLVNIYGPTETTVFACAHEVGDEAERDDPIPVGRAVAGAELLVLDPDGAPVPDGERGELHVAGAGIARGYLHQPQLTAERFATTHADGSRRVYRTGDLVRRRPDGVVEIFGRLDDQVKLRGYRVEPLEVEAQLAAHPAVAHAVVVAGGEDGRRRLAAFVVPAGAGCEEGALRSHLAERLPEYMVPATFALLASLPLTPNGKVDRRALAARAAPAERPADAAATAAGASPLAREIAALFAAVLGLPAVDPGDDFLALGGESLGAVQLLGRLRAQLGAELPISAVFEARTPAALAERVEMARGAPLLPPLLPRRHDGAVPATAGQAKALMIGELAEESLPYQSQAAHRIVGALDVAALERALSALVARHEILRTTFPRRDGRWLQQVHEPWPVRLELEDLRAADDPEAALAAHVAHVSRARLDPELLPPVRWSLARLADDEHALIALEHHVVHDGVSTAVVLEELAALYAAEVAHRPSPLAPPAVQFRDFAAWQEELVAGEQGRRTLAHWRARLADPPAPPELPFDRPRPERQTYRGGCLRRTLPAALTERVRACAQAAGATPFAVMLAAYATTLARSGGVEQVLVGSGLANRRALASERLVGMVVNTVALRIDTGGEPSVRELVERAHAAVVDAQVHQDVPFERVVEHVAPARARNAAPLYQTLFSFHDAPVRTLALPGATLVPRDALPNGSAKADLNVVVVHRRRGAAPDAIGAADYERIAEDGLTLVWEYNADLFERETAERLLDRFVHLLDQLAGPLDRPLSALEPAAAGERAWLGAHAGRAVPYERDASLADVFEARVAEAPGAPAVTADGHTLSYGLLDRRANRLAQRLRALGVGAGVHVGVCMERSLDLVVAFLAIAKAGGAYVPLDPLDPAERLRGQLSALAIPLVLTHVRHRTRVPAPARQIVCVDDELDLAREDDAPPPRACGPLDPAYVMFTSGSTGAPKAVQVPQRAVVRLVRGADYVALGPQETLLALAPPAFDASTFELWGALLNGGRLVVAPPGPLAPAELADLVAREHVSTLWLTAGLFRRVVDDRPDTLARLRHLLAGGDVLSPGHVRRALAVMHERAVLINGYGPTEGTTFTTAHRMTPADPPPDGPIPIGRPIANARVHVLDAHGRPVAVGAPGELWIGGDGVALGYANDPQLTAERFRPDPFAGEPGARMYRSGDRVRWRSDGALAFLGRADRQLKVRGFRVEPGEVEAALRSHPGVADAHVGPFERAGHDRALAAYVVARAGADPADAELRAHIAATLPAHALPSAWSRLERLPLTPNGKVDAAALPAPAPARPRASGPAATSLDPLERRLAAIWARALDVEEVGPEDDFFELGGHSLLAVELFDAIERAFGRRLPLATIFEAPTVRRLARALREDGWEQPRSCLVTLTGATSGTRPPLFLVAAGDGNSVGFGALARRLGPDQPLHALQQRGINGGAPLHVRVEAMAAHYLHAIRRVQPRGPYLLGGRCLGSLVAYELARRLEARGEQVALLAVLDSGGPLWRTRRLADGTPFDPVMHTALRRAGAPSAPADVFTADGGERFLRWLAEPEVVGDGGIAVTRYLHEVYRLRSDVRDAFPDLAGRDAAGFVAWGWSRGLVEHGLERRLLPPRPDRLPPPESLGARTRTQARKLGERIAWRSGELADLLSGERRAGAAARRRERVRLAGVRAAADYRAGAYGGVVTLIRSEEYRVQTMLEQWYGLDTAAVVEHRVAGSHRSMLREPDVASLAGCLRALVDEALAG